MDVKARPYSGALITLEGIEGAGKTTALSHLAAHLEERGEEVVVVREPGATAVGEKIRSVLMDPANESLCDDAELLLLFAARAQLIHEKIRPALLRGAFVLCDRFVDATYAYQGGGRGVRSSQIALLDRRFNGITPDLTFLLDLPVHRALERARSRQTEPDRFESQSIEFFERIRSSYWGRVKSDPDRFCVIDAGLELKAMLTAMVRWLENFCETERVLMP